MAELAVFSLASKVLSTIASPALQKAYEKGGSVWDARDDLDNLRETVETIHAVLLDAEKKQEGSAAVRNWIKRVKAVLYDADDLFDEVATDDMRKQQIKSKGNKHLNKVRVSCSKLNPIVSSNSIAQKVKAVRKSLLEISTDMAQFQFGRREREEAICTGMRKGQDPGSFVDSKDVIGREEDKNAVLGMLLHDQSNNTEHDSPVVVIAIVGIGGLGKTTLAQLVYNDEEVQKSFEKRWFACISDTSDDKEIIGKICQSMCGENYSNSDVSQLQSKIMGSVKGQKFLLVLDDVWDDNHGNWINRMRLLGGGLKGSKIIVTTRHLSVAGAVNALKTSHSLSGLSEDDSWNLFRRVALTPEHEKDSRWTDLGREIVKKCANVPLAIKSIGSLLYTKSTLQEWESFSKEELPRLGQNGHDDPIMPVLKLSYDHLNSNLKQCFAYCSLFPKDYEIEKQELIYLWMAQGYIKSSNVTQSVEEVGHSYFMDLLRRSFFQETREDDFGEIDYCKMHDLVHDLAQHVAGEESIMLTKSSSGVKAARHVCVGNVEDDPLPIPATTFNVHQLRSFLVMCRSSACTPSLVHEAVNLKYLRTLRLSQLGIENVPTCIGELKHLRYLDISKNRFKNLPDSITKLLNLCMLNISGCRNLETLPDDFRKLINLRHLENRGCFSLKYMPPGFEELTSLQRLDEFKVGGGGMSKLHALEGLRLTGELEIIFEDDTNDEWDGVECWQPPVNLQLLKIKNYKGRRIPKWGNRSKVSPTLTDLKLFNCNRVKCLPSFRLLSNLKSLRLDQMEELEYIEEEEDAGATDSGALFLPRLEKLELRALPKLEGWGRKVGGAATRNDQGHSFSTSHHLLLSFPSLSFLHIYECPELKWMPLCPCLARLELSSVNAELIPQLLSTRHSSPSIISSSSSSSLKHLQITHCNGLTSLPAESLTSLKHLKITECNGLTSLPGESLTSLKHLEITECNGLTSLPAESLTSLSIYQCNGLTSLPGESLTSLKHLEIKQCNGLTSLLGESLTSLKHLEITQCDGLTSLPAESLTSLSIRRCRNMKDVVVAPSHLNLLKNLRIQECPELELWEEEKRGVDWDSLPNLRQLTVDKVPTPERLPNCLRIRQADGKLKITRQMYLPWDPRPWTV